LLELSLLISPYATLVLQFTGYQLTPPEPLNRYYL